VSKVFSSKRDEVTGDWRAADMSSFIRKMRRLGHVAARMGKRKYWWQNINDFYWKVVGVDGKIILKIY